MSYTRGHFCFCHVTGIIIISGNCRGEIYKSYMHDHFRFYHMILVHKLTDLFAWACNKVEDQEVNKS